VDVRFLTYLRTLICERVSSRQRPHESPSDTVEPPALALLAPRTPADARAKELLLRLLSVTQREQLQHHGYFSVDAPGRGRFCILPIPIFNVLHLETGDCFCAAPLVPVPVADLMLAQKLLLENDPEAFFGVANQRSELPHGLVDEPSAADRILRARSRLPHRRIRWWEMSMIPESNHLV
jgi:hypothetical protein